MPTHLRLSRRRFILQSLATGAACLPCLHCASTGRPSPAAARKEDVWRIGCYTRPWDQHEYRVALDAIAEAGFKYVGLMTTKAPRGLIISPVTAPDEAVRVGEEVKKRGLQVASVYGGGPATTSMQTCIDDLRRLIDNCAAVGCMNLLMGGIGDAALHEIYYKSIAECCDYAAAKGMGISVKPHGGLNSTGPQCRKIIDYVGHRNFRLWYDPGNIYYYSDGKLDPVEDATTVDGLVVGMSVKDFLPPKNVDLTPGTGQVRFAEVMNRLGKGGFTRGPLVVETLKRGELPDLLAEAKKARVFLETLVLNLRA